MNKNEISTNGNNAGVAIFWLGSVTNDTEINYDILDKDLRLDISSLPSHRELEQFTPPDNTYISLSNEDVTQNEEEVIVQFANKLLGESKDIDSEIAKVVEKRFWDMV